MKYYKVIHNSVFGEDTYIFKSKRSPDTFTEQEIVDQFMIDFDPDYMETLDWEGIDVPEI